MLAHRPFMWIVNAALFALAWIVLGLTLALVFVGVAVVVSLIIYLLMRRNRPAR